MFIQVFFWCQLVRCFKEVIETTHSSMCKQWHWHKILQLLPRKWHQYQGFSVKRKFAVISRLLADVICHTHILFPIYHSFQIQNIFSTLEYCIIAVTISCSWGSKPNKIDFTFDLNVSLEKLKRCKFKH